MRNFEDPFKKVKVIREVRDLISVCINEFWAGIDVDYDQLDLDADQMLSIMTYVITQTDFCDLPCHLKLIEEFSSSEL